MRGDSVCGGNAPHKARKIRSAGVGFVLCPYRWQLQWLFNCLICRSLDYSITAISTLLASSVVYHKVTGCISLSCYIAQSCDREAPAQKNCLFQLTDHLAQLIQLADGTLTQTIPEAMVHELVFSPLPPRAVAVHSHLQLCWWLGVRLQLCTHLTFNTCLKSWLNQNVHCIAGFQNNCYLWQSTLWSSSLATLWWSCCAPKQLGLRLSLSMLVSL